MDTKGGEVDIATGELDEPLDYHVSGRSAWIRTQLKGLQPRHRSRQVDYDVIVYHRGAAGTDCEARQLLERKQRRITRGPRVRRVEFKPRECSRYGCGEPPKYFEKISGLWGSSLNSHERQLVECCSVEVL